MPPAQQLLWVIDRSLEDEYGCLKVWRLCWVEVFTPRHIGGSCGGARNAAEEEGKAALRRFSVTYRRERLLSWLLDAYRRGGQPEKVIPLLEKEADAAGATYAGRRLAGGRKREKARKWCVDGYGRTIADAPGLAAGLQERLRKMAEEEKNFALAAAYRAEDFFERPSIDGYQKLRKATEKSGSGKLFARALSPICGPAHARSAKATPGRCRSPR